MPIYDFSMIAPTRHRFTVHDYHTMAETGVLHPDARVELLQGEIIDRSPIGPFHGGVTNYLTQIFSTAAQGRWQVFVQNPVRLDPTSEPQPDLMLLRPSDDFYRSRHPRPEDVFLLIEVSDSSLELDRTVKVPAYAQAGISEVWIVNLNDVSVEVFRDGQPDGFASMTNFKAGSQISLKAFPDVIVNVGELFRRE